MELAVQVGLRNASLRASWIPILQNEEADALTNSDFRHFDLALRIDVDLASLEFKVTNQLFAVGDEYIEELAKAKRRGEEAQRVCPCRGRAATKEENRHTA